MSGSLLITGASLHLPGVPLAAALTERFGELGSWAAEDAAAPDKAATVLGRKGLLYKEPATRLALCAVHRAFGIPTGKRPDWPFSPSTAVVVASNLGNLETVARVARTVATEGGSAVSVLDAPNVSSNVIASTVALWFGFGGPNLMVCSGSTAGLDAIALSGLVLRAGRAERVVVVGVEPADEVATALFAAQPGGPALTAGAGCVVLERAPADRAPGQARVELLTADQRSFESAAIIGLDGFDLAQHYGDFYGAYGVIALALAALLARDGHPAVGVRGVGDDARGALVTTGGEP